MILFPTDFVAVRRTTTWVKGVATDATPTNVAFRGDMQPFSNRDEIALNVGRADVGKITVFSDRALQTSSQGPSGAIKGDLVTFEGKTYEIIQESAHRNWLIPHYEYYAELRA